MGKDLREVQKLMTYNEDGEGVINGKTIRELEAEIMMEYSKKKLPIKEFNIIWKNSSKEINKERLQKILKYLQNNTEIFIGILISLAFIFIYFNFKTNDENANISLLGGMIGGLGAILSILLSIAFSKRSNEQTWDATVLPYLLLKNNKKNPPENYISFVHIKDKKIWGPLDFEKIKNDKKLLVRNGIAYLHIENIGLGPAKKINIKVNNFGSIYLSKDYLQPEESMDIILNFNNPDDSINSDIIIEYETIRNIRHVQRYQANLTWHLDRTNFTLYS